jgi:hypothetical protein
LKLYCCKQAKTRSRVTVPHTLSKVSKVFDHTNRCGMASRRKALKLILTSEKQFTICYFHFSISNHKEGFVNILLRVLSIAALLSFSCSKSNPVNQDSTQKVKYLSQITLDGKLSTKYFYGNGNLIDSMNNYDSTGRITNHFEYQYFAGKPAVQIQRSYSQTGTGTYTYIYETQFNYLGFASQRSSYHGYVSNPDSLMSIDRYTYNNSKCVQISRSSGKDSLLYYYTYQYNSGNDIIGITYYTPSGTPVTTLSYTRDTNVNPNKFLSTLTINPNQHNALSLTSSTIDSLGRIYIRIGTIPVYYNAFNSVYQYDADNYPATENRTIPASIPVVSVYRYEYLQ